MDLAGALGMNDRELVAFVGAGGKKTAMAHLVETATDRGLRAGYATSTHMPPPPGLPLVVAGEEALTDALAGASRPVAFASEHVENPERAPEKVRGHAPGVLDDLFDRDLFDWLVVKADGARRREFKAPGPDEPTIPAASTHVVPVASVAAVGQPLDDRIVHRPERVAAITGLDVGDQVTARAVGTVLASDAGGCKALPERATATFLVNKADDPARQAAAREVLVEALSRTERPSRGLVCSFANDYLERVER